MASAQQERGDNKTSERGVHMEEHKVPKLTSHFEALVEKSQLGDSATITTTVGTCTTGGTAAAPIVEEAHKVIRMTEFKDDSRAQHGGVGGRAHFESIADKVADDRGGVQIRGGGATHQETQSTEALKQGKTGDLHQEKPPKQGFESTEQLKQGRTGHAHQQMPPKQGFESASSQEKQTRERTTEGKTGHPHQQMPPKQGFETASSQEKQTRERTTEGLKQGKAGQPHQQMPPKQGFESSAFDQEKQMKERSTEGLKQQQGKTGDHKPHKQGFRSATDQGKQWKERSTQESKQQGKTGDLPTKQGSSYEVGKFQVKNEGDVKEQGRQHLTPSLEEVSEVRQAAQQNSVEAVRAAEERYTKAKELAANAAYEAKESASHGIGAATTYAAHLGSKTKDQTLGGVQYIAEKAAPAKDTVVETAQRGYVTTKDTVAGAGQTAAGYTKQVAGTVKSGTVTAAQKAAETGMTVAEKAAETGKTAASMAAETGKTVGVKAVETGKTVGVKAVETGKTAGVKAAEVAVEVKDRAVVAGWGTAQYAGEKAVDATKAAAGLVKGVAGYTVGAAAAAKDVVVDVGRRTGEYVEEKTVAAGETMAEYAARKKEEAKHELEAKKREGHAPLSAAFGGEEKSGGGAQIWSEKKREEQTTTWTGTTSGGDKKKEGSQGGSGRGGSETVTAEQVEAVVETIVEEGGGVLGAIGETIAEIAQGVVAPPPLADPTAVHGQDKSGVCDNKPRRSV